MAKLSSRSARAAARAQRRASTGEEPIKDVSGRAAMKGSSRKRRRYSVGSADSESADESSSDSPGSLDAPRSGNKAKKKAVSPANAVRNIRPRLVEPMPSGLPHALWRQVLCYLPRSEQLQARLINRKWRVVVASPMLSDVVLSPPKDLNMVSEVAPSTLRSLVNSIGKHLYRVTMKGFWSMMESDVYHTDRREVWSCEPHAKAILCAPEVKLHSLRMIDCSFGEDDDVYSVVGYIGDHSHTLEELHLENTPIRGTVHHLRDNSRVWEKLKVLRLSGCGISNCDIPAHKLFEVASGSDVVPFPQMQTLDLTKNGLGLNFATNLKAVGKTWYNLEHLILDDNLIGHAGAPHVGHLVAWLNLKLKTLSMNGTDIRRNGLEAMLKIIAPARMHNITEMSFAECWLGTQGVSVLAKHIRSFPKLEKLHIESNCITRRTSADRLGNAMPAGSLLYL